MTQAPPPTVQPGSHVVVELLAASGETQQLEFDLVPDGSADFSRGYLGLSTPLAETILNQPAGAVLPYQQADILAVLTDKQREVMVAAFQNGYYDFPKKISSKRLCRKVGISKPTLLQHMRKAECRIFREIIMGF